MNSSMNTMMWRTTHRFGALMLGLLLLFAAWEIAHDEEASSAYRIGGASVVGVLGFLAVLKCLRPGSQDSPAASPPGPARRRRSKARG